MKRRFFLTALPAGLAIGAGRFTQELWTAIVPIYAATLKHPFLTGLADGSLPRSRFQFYLVQDALYLDAFSRALSVLASKAPRTDWAIAFSRDAIESLEVERQMHGQILGSYGVTAQTIGAAAMAPVNYAYTNHLMAAAERGTFLEGLAAMLPCYWIYWEVGKQLEKRGSKNRDYQRWIAQYSGEAYGKTVQRVLAVADEEAVGASAGTRERARKLFVLSARYEYQFWDSAWREERWVP